MVKCEKCGAIVEMAIECGECSSPTSVVLVHERLRAIEGETHAIRLACEQFMGLLMAKGAEAGLAVLRTYPPEERVKVAEQMCAEIRSRLLGE